MIQHYMSHLKMVSFENEDVANNMLNEDLTQIYNWANQWLVTFSQSKTKSMTLSNKQANSEPLKFNNVQLEEVSEHKHLGLTFSNKLSWSAHINNIISDVSKMSDVMKRLKYDLDRHNLDKIYKTFVRLKLEYASHIWDNCSKKD